MGMSDLGLSGGKMKAAKDVDDTPSRIIRCQILQVSLTYGMLLS